MRDVFSIEVPSYVHCAFLLPDCATIDFTHQCDFLGRSMHQSDLAVLEARNFTDLKQSLGCTITRKKHSAKPITSSTARPEPQLRHYSLCPIYLYPQFAAVLASHHALECLHDRVWH